MQLNRVLSFLRLHSSGSYMRFLLDSGLVALGAALGANARYWTGYWFVGKEHYGFPWHTLLINVAGSLVLGAFLSLSLIHGWGHGWRLLVAVGICGGFTTFSAFSADFVRLMEEGQAVAAAGYFIGTNVFSILACLGGAHFARVVWPSGSPG
jgi:CrcB protein